MKRLILTLINMALAAYFLLSTQIVPPEYIIYVDLVVYLILLISVTYATEINVALSGVREWWNVMVVSTIFTIPQTLYAIRLAMEGKYIAAWVDTLASTVVDSLIITAILRRNIIGSALVRAAIIPIIGWALTALSINLFINRIAEDRTVNLLYVAMGYFFLPAMLVNWKNIERPSTWQLLTLLNNTIAMGIASWQMSEVILQLQLEEVQLGITSTILATLPDFFVALIMRSAFAWILSEEASEVEVFKTMVAAAIHDQVTVPALIVLFAPQAAAYYPHMFNIAIILLIFTLLHRKAYWFIGLPGAILLLLMPPI